MMRECHSAVALLFTLGHCQSCSHTTSGHCQDGSVVGKFGSVRWQLPNCLTSYLLLMQLVRCPASQFDF